jgi:hypothetical protein
MGAVAFGVEPMKNIKARILFSVAGLSMLLLALSCTRAVRTTAGAEHALGLDAGRDASDASAPVFTLCTGAYALCTRSACKPIVIGADGFLNCYCDVKHGESVGQDLCAAVPPDPAHAGQSIPSRYFPPKAMQVCTNTDNRPWAACLDMPCVVDKNNPVKATCVCVSSDTLLNVAKVDYVVDVANEKPPCTSDNLSSATFADATLMTCFLQGKLDGGIPPPELDGGKWICPLPSP